MGIWETIMGMEIKTVPRPKKGLTVNLSDPPFVNPTAQRRDMLEVKRSILKKLLLRLNAGH